MANQLNAERDLFEVCREWRRLAEAEGEAIRTGNWGFCSACQKALQPLRERITTLLPVVRAEWMQPGGDHAARQQLFDDTIRQLIELQRRNQALIKAARETAHAKIQQLNQARIKLKQLRRSYGFTPGTALNSFF
jgi:hypothetical protein